MFPAPLFLQDRGIFPAALFDEQNSSYYSHS
jgi:hypothetical protein